MESQLDKFRSEIHAEQGSTVGGLQRLAADHQVRIKELFMTFISEYLIQVVLN